MSRSSTFYAVETSVKSVIELLSGDFELLRNFPRIGRVGVFGDEMSTLP